MARNTSSSISSDITGDYEVVVEGMTNQGISGKGAASFAVRPYEN